MVRPCCAAARLLYALPEPAGRFFFLFSVCLTGLPIRRLTGKMINIAPAFVADARSELQK